uniref:Uncharacterized protein n=1 Tax=viral metagenome TaxID=1070528 RepID=A0A6M3J5N5_9ZZZZ
MTDEMARRDAFAAGRMAGLREAVEITRQARRQIQAGQLFSILCDIHDRIVDLYCDQGQAQAWEKYNSEGVGCGPT